MTHLKKKTHKETSNKGEGTARILFLCRPTEPNFRIFYSTFHIKAEICIPPPSGEACLARLNCIDQSPS